MKIAEYRKTFLETLAPIYDVMEAENFFYLLLDEFRGLKRVDLAVSHDLEFSGEEISKWGAFLAQLKREIPIQYIIGKAHFYGLEFKVSNNVLIPRPETEELVDWIVKEYEFKGNPKILDIGTGSGCIAISLAKNLPDSNVFAIDVSPGALEIAEYNAKQNNVSVTFLEQDILKTTDLRQQFDIIVSNPPYVRNLEKEGIRKNVLDNEPHLALFVDDEDALVFYRKIAGLGLENLNPNGALYFEINQYLGPEMLTLLENKGYKEVVLRKDIFENDRMLKGNRP
jgi:release factor glutamine methyltransferase